MKPSAEFSAVLVTAPDLKIARGVVSSLWLDLIGAFTPTSDVGAGRRHYSQIRTVVSAVGAKSL
jgi:hypothetical protein